MKIVNLTPHTLNVKRSDGSVLDIQSSGLARVSTTPVPVHEIDGIVIFRSEAGPITGLPDPQDGVLFVVSAMVAERANRGDVLSPGDLIRNAEGQPVACNGLRAYTKAPPKLTFGGPGF